MLKTKYFLGCGFRSMTESYCSIIIQCTRCITNPGPKPLCSFDAVSLSLEYKSIKMYDSLIQFRFRMCGPKHSPAIVICNIGNRIAVERDCLIWLNEFDELCAEGHISFPRMIDMNSHQYLHMTRERGLFLTSAWILNPVRMGFH